MPATVAVLGGGYGGMTVAKALDDVADVVLVEPRDAFVHNVAALRGVVDREWTDRLFYRYDRLLERGRVVHDRAVRVSGTEIALGSGQTIEADYVVLATGSSYPFPAKIDVLDSAAAKDRLHATRDSLERADRVLLLGAGPVGLEFAGEIRAAWPEKAVTIVDPAGDVLPAFPVEFRSELRRQLEVLRIELVMGTSLRDQPRPSPGSTRPSPPRPAPARRSPPTSGSAASASNPRPATSRATWRPPARRVATWRSPATCGCPARSGSSPSETSPRSRKPRWRSPPATTPTWSRPTSAR
ncbi:FAD-dependent oxidoreductase [Saccharopolyspora spinosporotrichia]